MPDQTPAQLAAYNALVEGVLACDAAPCFEHAVAAANSVVDEVSPFIAADALDDMADRIDNGPTFPLPPSVISALVRERAADLRAGNTKETSTDE
jgi:hypothetical protein